MGKFAAELDMAITTVRGGRQNMGGVMMYGDAEELGVPSSTAKIPMASSAA
jgi:hypothetical protein